MAESIPVPVPGEKELARFWAKVEKQDGDGCWLWRGAMFTQGYGAFSFRGKLRRAHRVAYVWAYGELPDGHSGLDHICEIRACVRPDHMRPSSTRENVLRGEGPTAENARKEFCVNGHKLDYTDPRGWRGCRICRREAVARYNRRKRDA